MVCISMRPPAEGLPNYCHRRRVDRVGERKVPISVAATIPETTSRARVATIDSRSGNTGRNLCRTSGAEWALHNTRQTGVLRRQRMLRPQWQLTWPGPPTPSPPPHGSGKAAGGYRGSSCAGSFRQTPCHLWDPPRTKYPPRRPRKTCLSRPAGSPGSPTRTATALSYGNRPKPKEE